MSGIITPQQLEFLKLLSKTGFITNKHLKQIAFASPQNSKHHLTKRPLDGGYIGRVMVSAPYGMGRKVMYFLTKKGAELVAYTYNIDMSELVYTNAKGGIANAKDGNEATLIRADFIHKENYICAYLAFENYLKSTDYSITEAKHYYQLAGDKGTGLQLNGRNFRPDGIWFFDPISSDKPQYIYIVEIHRYSDRKHIVKQLKQQVEAIKQRSLQKRFNTEKPHFVLSIFANENVDDMPKVIAELQQSEDWAYIEKFFMFGKLDDLIKDFYNEVAYFGGSKKPLPPKIA